MDPKIERLRELTDYDAVTGRFTRSRTEGGQVIQELPRKEAGAHQDRWQDVPRRSMRMGLCMTGDWPARRVIHEDGDVKNDCWANLELEDKAGVYYDEARDKWCAKIGRDRGGSIPRRKRTLLTARHLPNAACKKSCRSWAWSDLLILFKATPLPIKPQNHLSSA